MKLTIAVSPRARIQFQRVRANTGWLGIRIMCPRTLVSVS